MADPVAFISHHHVLPGKESAIRAFLDEGTPRLEAAKPRTLVFTAFIDEPAEPGVPAEVAIIHLFADADALDAHLEGAAERSAAAYELIVPVGFEIFGRPSEAAKAMLEAGAKAAGVPVRHFERYEAGFLRVAS